MTALRIEADTVTRNLAAWPARLPQPDHGGSDLTRVELSSSGSTLVLRDGDRWVPVHSRRDPLREVERALSSCHPAEESTLFVIGFGLGYVADLLEQRLWTGSIVALEPDAASVRACLARRDWSSWLAGGRLSWVWAPDYRGLDAIVPTLSPHHDEPRILVNPVLARCHASLVEEATRRATRAWFGARANQDAKRRMAGRYLLNTLRNARTLARAGDVSSLSGCFAGVPAVVVAAGPSLDRNLPELAAHRQGAVLIAVDTALRPLLTAGLAPDLVVAVDPTEANARHLVDLPPCEATYLVGEGSLDPEAIRSFADRQFVFRVGDHHPWPWLRAQGLDRGRLRAWGSVLTTAFDLALVMGCDPIVFAGADLAFTDGRPYARGTTYEEDWRRDAAWGQRLEDVWRARINEWPDTREVDVHGRAVRTAPHLVAFRDWLATESAAATGRRIVNATGHGILHGPGIAQSTISAELSNRLPHGQVARADISAAWASSQRPSAWAVGPIPVDTESEWSAFADVSPETRRAALNQVRARTSVGSTPALENDGANDVHRAGTPQSASVGEAIEDPFPDIGEADARYLRSLSQTHTLRVVTLSDPGLDLISALRQATAGLTPSSAVVVIDRVGHAVGAQVRRAVNVILCERTDVWLEHRRFVDRESRLSILRVDDGGHVRSLVEIDALKWRPEHAAVAESLVPLIVAELAPRSVIDIACGGGYWLRAFERHGVERLRGLTMRSTDGAAHAGVTACKADELLTGLPSWSERGHERFDLCLAMEVALELPPTAHASFVAACARLSDVVVFSYRPPGAPGMSPYARPLTYWTDRFWDVGFVLEDRLRGLIEERWNFPRTTFDGPLVFRRGLTLDEQRDVTLRARQQSLVARLNQAYEQGHWWAVRSLTAAVSHPERPRATGSFRWWSIPAWRWLGDTVGSRRLTFRSDAARCYLSDPRAELSVREDHVTLPRLADVSAVLEGGGAGWALTRDELVVRSADGSDPRHNGRCYAVRVPAFVAWAEDRSPSESLDCCRPRRLAES